MVCTITQNEEKTCQHNSQEGLRIEWLARNKNVAKRKLACCKKKFNVQVFRVPYSIFKYEKFTRGSVSPSFKSWYFLPTGRDACRQTRARGGGERSGYLRRHRADLSRFWPLVADPWVQSLQSSAERQAVSSQELGHCIARCKKLILATKCWQLTSISCYSSPRNHKMLLQCFATVAERLCNVAVNIIIR